MTQDKAEERHFTTGCYTCPKSKKEAELEAEVPRAWVHWPIRVQCRACGEEHLLEYDDVHQCCPVFGYE